MNKILISLILLFISNNIHYANGGETAAKTDENEDVERFLQPMISEGLIERNQTMFEMEEDHERLCGVEGRLIKERGNYLVQCSSDAECLPPSQCHESGFCCMIALNQEPPPVGCPMGTRSLRSTNGSELTCNPAMPNSCPGGATCYTDSLTLQKRCCGSDPGQGCPAGSRAVLTGEQPRQCIPGRTVCPNGALCQWSHLIDRYQCCEPDNGCPRHQSPLKTDRGDALTCSPGSSPCPGGASCRFNFWTASHQCCRVDVADLCPSGSVPFLHESDSSPKSCKNDQECPSGYFCGDNKLCCGAPGACPNAFSPLTDMYGRLTACTTRSGNTCPTGSSCQPSILPGQRLCCVQEDYQCPGDATPYPDMKNPHVCNLADPYACPHGQCMPSNIRGVSICCKSSFIHQKPSGINPCPAGWALQDNQLSYCTPNSFTTTCPGFSSCMRSSAVQQQFVCCVPATQPSSDTCRRPEAVPERFPNGIQRRCAAGSGFTQCGTGFSCQPSVRNGWLCCSNPPFAQAQIQYFCPIIGQQPVVDRITGGNQFCSSPGQTSGCPANALCLGSRDVSNMYICCSSGPSTLNPICPNNGVPQPSNTGYVSCSIGLGNCAPGYACTRAANDFNIQMCCSSNSLQQPVCPDQQTVLMTNGRPQTCALTTVNPCPNGYACQPALGTFGTYICCTVPNAPQCPNNFVPFINPQGNSISCNLARPEGCPQGSICLQATNSNNFALCCRSSAAARVCPNNQNALLTPNGSPENCGGPGSSCSRAGYTCQYSTAYNSYVCCGNDPVAAVCADGRETYVQTAGQTYTCNSLVFPSGCPVNYDCALSTRQGTFVCCRSRVTPPLPPITPPIDVNQCPNGWNPHRNAVDNQLRTCYGSNDMSCPTGFSCTPSSQSSRFLCCRLASSISCPVGSTYLSNNQPRLCSKNRLNQCPRGYSCEQSTNPTITICCSTRQQDESIKCPDGSAPSKLGENVRSCPTVNSLDGCPVGHICQFSNKGLRVCCQRSTSLSRFAPVSHVSSSTGSPSSLSSIQCPNGVSAGILTDTCQTTAECPKHSSCTKSSNVPGVAICCANVVPSDTRCKGRRTLLNAKQPVECLSGQTCFDGYECSSQTINGRSVCCETETLALATCPQNRVPYIIARTETVMFCDDTAFICPHGFECKQTLDKTRHVCCSAEMKCASGAAELNENGMIKRCFSPNSCGFGYVCADSATGKGQLCCSEGLTPAKEPFSFPISTRIQASLQDSVDKAPKNEDAEWVIVEG